MKILRRLGLLALLSVVAVFVAAWLPTTEQKTALLSGQKPTWSWDFARTGALPPNSTFSRTSGARQYLSDGTLGWAPENLVTYSQQIDNAAWTKNQSSVNADATTAPNGTTTADKLTEDSTASTVHRIISPTFAQLLGPMRTAVYAKNAGRRYFRMENAAGAGTFGATFDTQAGTTSNVDAGVTATITDAGNGWYLCEIAFAWPTTSNTNVWVMLQNTAGNSSYNGDGSSGVYFWGFQVNHTPNASSAYWPTTSAAYFGPRFDFDPATKAPLGYLAEVGTTNLVVRSQELQTIWDPGTGLTVTADQTTAPDGTTTAEKFTENVSASNGTHAVYQNFTLANDTYTSVSAFVKAGTRSNFWVALRETTDHCAVAVFNTAGGTTAATQTATGSSSGTISSTYMRSVGNGWYRISLTAKVSAGSADPYMFVGLATAATGNTVNSNCDIVYAGDGTSYGYVWGAQADTAGMGVTSYYPTAGSTATRGGDNLTMPIASLTGWDFTQGGVIATVTRLHTIVPVAPGYYQPSLNIHDGTANNSIMVVPGDEGLGRVALSIRQGGSTALNISNGSNAAPFVRSKLAAGWSKIRGQLSKDGAVVFNGANAMTLPTGMTTVEFGRYVGGHTLQGTIESVSYWRGARSDAFVQGVSR